MAQVQRKGDLLMVQYVTGPQHVWLGAKFSLTQVEPALVAHPPLAHCSHGEIDEERLVSLVVAVAQEQQLFVERIEYVSDDSPNYNIYQHCARMLAKLARSELR